MTPGQRTAAILGLVVLACFCIAGMTALAITDHTIPDAFTVVLTGIVTAVAALFVPRKGND